MDKYTKAFWVKAYGLSGQGGEIFQKATELYKAANDFGVDDTNAAHAERLAKIYDEMAPLINELRKYLVVSGSKK